MADLKFSIDASEIAAAFKELALEVEQDLKKGVANLASMTDAMIKEMAQSELHSSREEYLKNLSMKEITPGVWVVTLAADAMWIEEGIPAGKDMKPDLLKNAETSNRSGIRYKVIPFEHSKAPANMTPKAQEIVKKIRDNLKKDNINFKKLEKNEDGSPKRGLLHQLSYGGAIPGKGNTPAMDRIHIYQTPTKDGGMRRDIMTFRTVHSGPNQKDKWIHPGMDAKKFLDKAFEKAMKEWEDKILPEILAKWGE